MALSSKNTRDHGNRGNQIGVILLPKGVDLFKVDKSATVKMVIIPYTVPAGAKHPVAKDGELHYSRDYFVHRNFGPSGKDYAICPRLTHGGRCPICDGIRDQLETGQMTKEQAKKLRPSQRTLYNVWLPDQNKTALFDVPHYGFTEPLNLAVSAKVAIPGREWIDYFADADEGSFIWATFVQTPLPTGPWYPAKSFEFEKHGGLPPDIRQAALPLDNLLAVATYEELKARFYDIDAESSPEEQPADAGIAPPSPIIVPPVVEPVADLRKPPAVGVPTTYPPAASAAPKAADVPASSPTPKATAPTKSGLAKGDKLFHKTLGAVTVHKVAGDVVTVMDSEEEPQKVKPADLSATPFAAETPEPAAPVAEEASDSSTEEWDADWDQK